MVPDPTLRVPKAPAPASKLLNDMVMPVQHRLDQLGAYKEELTDCLSRATAEETTLKRVLAIISSDKPRARRRSRRGNASRVGRETLDSVRPTIIRFLSNGETLTQKDVQEALGLSVGKVSVIFKALRAEGTIRLAGKQGRQNIYKLTPAAKEQYGTAKPAA